VRADLLAASRYTSARLCGSCAPSSGEVRGVDGGLSQKACFCDSHDADEKAQMSRVKSGLELGAAPLRSASSTYGWHQVCSQHARSTKGHHPCDAARKKLDDERRACLPLSRINCCPLLRLSLSNLRFVDGIQPRAVCGQCVDAPHRVARGCEAPQCADGAPAHKPIPNGRGGHGGSQGGTTCRQARPRGDNLGCLCPHRANERCDQRIRASARSQSASVKFTIGHSMRE
jgi:hypothetical protein